MSQEPQLVIEIEEPPDYSEIARLANISFGGNTDKFNEQQVRWFYQQAFGGDTCVVSAKVDGNKAGQAVLIWYWVNLGSRKIECVQVIDLFVLPEYRSFGIARHLYAKLSELIEKRPGCMVLAVPNIKSVKINQRFLNLELRNKMDIRLGAAFPWLGSARIHSVMVDKNQPDPALKLLRVHLNERNTVETNWTADGLLARLLDEKHQYALHSARGMLLVTSKRHYKYLPLVLVCAVFCDPGQETQSKKLRQMLRASAHFHHRPLYLYLGVNQTLPFRPGIRVPDKIRPSLMQIQIREPKDTPVLFERFEAIDFDFA